MKKRKRIDKVSDLTRFYEGTPKTSDQIEHYGNKNSGRYPRGSGKEQHKQDRIDARHINRNLTKLTNKMVKTSPEWKRTRGRRIAGMAFDAATIPITAGLTGFGITLGTAIGYASSYKKSSRELYAKDNGFKKAFDLEVNNRYRKISIDEARKLYNSKDIKDLEEEYVKNPKMVSQGIEHSTGNARTIAEGYSMLSGNDKKLIFAISDTMRSGENITPEESTAYFDLSDDEKAVIMTLALVLSKALINKTEEVQTVNNETQQGPSPWSSEFYLGSDKSDGVEQGVFEVQSNPKKKETERKAAIKAQHKRGGVTVGTRESTNVVQGPSPWSSEFYLSVQNTPSLEQSGVKGMKWEEHLKAKAEELVGDAKKAGKAVGNQATAIKDKGLAALNNAHTKKVKPELDANINILVSAFPHGINKATGKNVTYKDIKDLVDKSAGTRKMSDKDRAYITNETARRLITNTSSTTSVDSVKQERLNKGKNIQKDARADKNKYKTRQDQAVNKAVKMGINDDRVINYVRKYADPKYKKMSNTDIAEEILVEHDHNPTFSNMIPDILRALGRW